MENMEESRRQKIKEVYADKSLTPQQKQSKIAEIMGYGTGVKEQEQKVQDEHREAHEAHEAHEACVHYQRGCLIQCDKCDKFVECRLCHGELDRFKVTTVKCKKCDLVQSSKQICENIECGHVFGEYYCDVCHLFDSTPESPKHHCEGCGICRVGTIEEAFHCDKCNMCWDSSSKDDHKCFGSDECCICQDTMDRVFNDPVEKKVIAMKCGHMFHKGCVGSYLQNDYRCPMCRKSLISLTAHTEYIDRQLETLNSQEIDYPEELKNKQMDVLCNECETQFTATFSPFQIYKCYDCGNYNSQLIHS